VAAGVGREIFEAGPLARSGERLADARPGRRVVDAPRACVGLAVRPRVEDVDGPPPPAQLVGPGDGRLAVAHQDEGRRRRVVRRQRARGPQLEDDRRAEQHRGDDDANGDVGQQPLPKRRLLHLRQLADQVEDRHVHRDDDAADGAENGPDWAPWSAHLAEPVGRQGPAPSNARSRRCASG
jgi:hypothetical protein